MTLYPWYVFITVAEQKSFVKAARILNVTQSAVSHTIAKLEAEYGYFLFVRNRNNVELTTNGKLMMPYVRNLLACMESLDQEIANLGNISKGQVKVAAFNSATLSWIPEILKEFQKEYPGIRVIVRQAGDKNIQRMIPAGEVELAFVSKDMIDSNTLFFPLHKTPLVCLTPKEYTPINGKSITAEDLRGKPLILQSEGYDTEMIKFLRQNKLPVKADFRIEVDATCHAYVEKGFGFCIAPLMTFHCNPRDVSVWPIEPAYMRIIGLVTVFPDFISPAASLFRDRIIRYMSESQLMNV